MFRCWCLLVQFVKTIFLGIIIHPKYVKTLKEKNGIQKRRLVVCRLSKFLTSLRDGVNLFQVHTSMVNRCVKILYLVIQHSVDQKWCVMND